MTEDCVWNHWLGLQWCKIKYVIETAIVYKFDQMFFVLTSPLHQKNLNILGQRPGLGILERGLLFFSFFLFLFSMMQFFVVEMKQYNIFAIKQYNIFAIKQYNFFLQLSSTKIWTISCLMKLNLCIASI